MQQPERPRPGYLQRVLTDGTRPARLRAGTRALLGVGGDGGFQSAATGMAPGFTYAHPAYAFFETILDFRADAPDIGPASSPESRSPRPAAALPGHGRKPLMTSVAGNAADVVIGRDAVREPSGHPTRPAHQRGDGHFDVPVAEARAATAHDTIGTSYVPGGSPPPFVTNVPATDVPKVLDVRVDPARPANNVSPATGLTPAGKAVGVHGDQETVERESGQLEIDIQKMSPAMRALMPMLGRIRLAQTAAPPAPGSARAQQEQSPPSSTVNREELVPRARHSTVGSAPPLRAPAAPSHASLVAQQTIMQLRKNVHALAAKAVAPRPDAANGGASSTAHERDRRPARKIERVVTTRVVTLASPARAFWERRYLGRPHMRAFR